MASTPTGHRPASPTRLVDVPREAGRLLLVAVEFLTRVPVPTVAHRPGDLRRSTAAFPLVGVLVGGVALGVWAAVAPLLGGTVAAVAAVLAAVAVTGAFHEDGLADTVDGLWGGGDPARRLEIMRDSRVGTYGAVALVGSLGLRMALLADLELVDVARALLAGHVLGRGSVLVLVRWLGPHDDQGSGATVAEPLGPLGSAVAAVTVLAVLVPATGVWAPLVVGVGLAGLGLIRRAARRRLGGLVGDVLGAGQQVVLLTTMATVVALARSGAW